MPECEARTCVTNFNFKPKRGRDDYGWQVRNLRHFDGPQCPQFVTFRLFDSLPADLLDQWRSQCTNDVAFRKRVERYLDSGAGECWLAIAAIATIVVNAFKFYDQQKYDLHSWVIMPNHVHLLLSPFEHQHLPDILHTIKSFSAQESNKFLNRKGQFWQHESFDRYIRDSRHFSAVVRYIENNPVKACLCKSPEEWRFGSSFERAQIRS